MGLRALLPLCVFAIGCGDPIADARLSIGVAITSVFPDVTSSRGGEEIVVEGRNFDADVVLSIGGQSAGLLARTDTQLNFVAPQGRVGPKDVTVTNPDGRTAVLAAGLRYLADDVSFDLDNMIVEGGVPLQVAAGDFDGDDRDDLLVAENESVTVYLNRGGRFVSTVTIDVVERRDLVRPIQLIDDLNGDGLQDIVLTDGVHLGRGDGTFQDVLVSELSVYVDVEAGDVDGDGQKSLFAFGWVNDLEDLRFSEFVVEGGALRHVMTYPEITILGLSFLWRHDLVIEDLDGDGYDDLAHTDPSDDPHGFGDPPTSTLWVRFGPDLVVTATAVAALATIDAFDIDEDGRSEIVSYSDGATRVYQVGEDRSLSLAAELSAPCPRFGRAGRYSRYRELERVAPGRAPVTLVQCSGTAELQVYRWSPDLTYERSRFHSGLRTHFAIGNLDGGPFGDLVAVVEGGIEALFGLNDDFASDFSRTVGTPVTLPERSTPTDGVLLVEGNFGDDRRLAGLLGNEVHLFSLGEEGVVGGPSATVVVTGDAEEIAALVPCDADGDGDDDIVVTGTRWAVSLVVNEGAFLRANSVGDSSLSCGIDGVLAGRLGENGACGIISCDENDRLLGWHPARPEVKSAVRGLPPAFTSRPYYPSVLDVDQDGLDDLIVPPASPDACNVSVFINQGDGLSYDEITVALPFDDDCRVFGVFARPKRGAMDGALDAWVVSSADVAAPPQALTRYRVINGTIDRTTKTFELLDETTVRLDFPPRVFHELDANADGLVDLLLARSSVRQQHAQTLGLVLALQDGPQGQTLPIVPEEIRFIEPRPNWYGAAVLDFDEDGLDDLVFSHRRAPGKLIFARNTSE